MSQAASKRELIIVRAPEMGFQSRLQEEGIVPGEDVSPLRSLLEAEGLTLRPLFGTSEEHLQSRAASIAAQTGADVPDLSIYYTVDAPDERLDALAERLRQVEGIEGAYVKPPTEPASFRFNDMAPQVEAAPLVTPDFMAKQGYLDPAVTGVEARYA